MESEDKIDIFFDDIVKDDDWFLGVMVKDVNLNDGKVFMFEMKWEMVKVIVNECNKDVVGFLDVLI